MKRAELRKTGGSSATKVKEIADGLAGSEGEKMLRFEARMLKEVQSAKQPE